MDIEDLVDEILLLTRHSDPQHDHPSTNERMIRAEVWDKISEYVDQEVHARTVELQNELEILEKRR